MSPNRQRSGAGSAHCITRIQATRALRGIAWPGPRPASVRFQASGGASRQPRAIVVALAAAALALVCGAALALDPGISPDERIFAGGFEANIVFVTSTTHSGNLGGLAGADAICQASALNAGLQGTYRAWLSATGVDAPSRLGGARGWIRTDSQPVADTTADLASAHLFHPIDVDEKGAFVDNSGSIVVYTATRADGTYFGQNCNVAGGADWSSTSSRTVMGISTSDNANFTDYTILPCTTSARLYCFGVDAIHPVSPWKDGL